MLLRQLIYADKILLNKIDLIPEKEKENYLEDVQDIIRKVNPTAQIVQSTYSSIGLDFLIEKNPVSLK